MSSSNIQLFATQITIQIVFSLCHYIHTSIQDYNVAAFLYSLIVTVQGA